MPGKKANTAIFMVAATIVNILLMLIFFVGFGIVITLLMNWIPALQNVTMLMILAWFALSIFLSFLTYSRIVKWATAKFSLEDKLDPIFTPRRNRPRREE